MYNPDKDKSNRQVLVGTVDDRIYSHEINFHEINYYKLHSVGHMKPLWDS